MAFLSVPIRADPWFKIRISPVRHARWLDKRFLDVGEEFNLTTDGHGSDITHIM
jgi:hypothetical protein